MTLNNQPEESERQANDEQDQQLPVVVTTSEPLAPQLHSNINHHTTDKNDHSRVPQRDDPATTPNSNKIDFCYICFNNLYYRSIDPLLHTLCFLKQQ